MRFYFYSFYWIFFQCHIHSLHWWYFFTKFCCFCVEHNHFTYHQFISSQFLHSQIVPISRIFVNHQFIMMTVAIIFVVAYVYLFLFDHSSILIFVFVWIYAQLSLWRGNMNFLCTWDVFRWLCVQNMLKSTTALWRLVPKKNKKTISHHLEYNCLQCN